MAGQSATYVTLKNVRFSYVHAFEPYKSEVSDKAKYSVVVIIDKDDEETLEIIRKAVQAAYDKGVNTKWEGKKPKKWKNPLRDGDEDRDSEEYENSYFINASTLQRPAVVGRKGEALDAEEFYSGCYGAVSINFYPFSAKGNKGVAAGLNNLMKLRDGERLSGGPSASDDFSDLYSTEDDEGDDLL